MTPEEQIKQLEAIIALLSKGSSRLSDSFSGLAKQYQAGTIDQKKFKEGLSKLNDELKTKTNPSFGQFALNIARGNKQFQSMQAELDDLSRAIEDTTDISTKAILERKREDLQRKESHNKSVHDVAQLTHGLGTALVGGVTTAVGGLARDLQAGASSTKIATGLMNFGVDLAAAGATATGGLLATGGQAMQASAALAKTGKTKLLLTGLGVALEGAGKATAAITPAMSKLAKFGIEILAAEVEKTVNAFNTMSASGAIFANGMQGMRDASAGAGLSVDQFSRVVQANSQAMGESGLGVAAGAAAVGRVGKIFDQNGGKIRTELRNLGYGVEEQAELTAQTIANMRRTAGGPVTDTAVAEQTQKYAENLRIIAGLTGEDAKAKEKQNAQQNQILAFQQYLAGKTPEQRASINAAMSLMTEQEKKNLRDRAIFNGQVINTEGAIYESMNAAAAEKGKAIFGQLSNNEMTAQSVAEANAEYGDSIKEAGLANREFAAAAYLAGGVLGGVATAQLDSINQANVQTKEAIGAIVSSVNDVKKTTDPLTTNMQNAANAAQALVMQMQEALDGPIAGFADVSDAMLTTVTKMIEELGLGKGRTPASPTTSTATPTATPGTSITDRLMAGAEGAMGGAALGGMVGLAGGPAAVVTSTIGATAGAITGAVYGAFKPEFDQLGKTMMGWFSSKEGKARGGIATGPDSGYLEKLHGTEAVIPTVGGKVPIDLTMSASPDAGMRSTEVSSVPDVGLIKSSLVEAMTAALTTALQTSQASTLSAFTPMAGIIASNMLAGAELRDNSILSQVAEVAQQASNTASSFLSQGKDAILALTSPITDSFKSVKFIPDNLVEVVKAAQESGNTASSFLSQGNDAINALTSPITSLINGIKYISDNRAEAAQQASDAASTVLSQGKEAILTLTSPITDLLNSAMPTSASRTAEIAAALSMMTQQERQNFNERSARNNTDNDVFSSDAIVSATTAALTAVNKTEKDQREQTARDTTEFQQAMLTMMQQFIQEQQTMTTKLDDQIRQTEKLVVAAT